VFEVAVYRLIQGALSSAVLWTSAALGLNLWALPAQLATALVCTLVFLGVRYRRFFAQMLALRVGSSFEWRTDIWPMQWQLALQGIAGYFSASLLVPVMFSYHGAVEAGRMGLSLQVVFATGALATSWLVVALPRLGTTFASGHYARFESEWQRASAASLAVVAIAGALVILAAIVGAHVNAPAAQRFLAPLEFALLVLWALMLQIVQCFAIYWRAQRVELLRFWGILPGGVTGLAVWLMGARFGAVGGAAGALAAATLVTVPLCGYLFVRSRQSVRQLDRADSGKYGMAATSNGSSEPFL
jgi:hypothetical protein